MKYGIWKIRYTQNAANTFEDWVRSERAPVLFATEIGALEYKRHLEMITLDKNTEFTVRRYAP